LYFIIFNSITKLNVLFCLFNLVHKKKIITPEEEKISLEDLSEDLENLTSAGVLSGDDEERR
jgi:hypothetical protein